MKDFPAWVHFACGSAFFAAATSILGKVGVSEVNSNFATFIRTVSILIFTAILITAREQWQPIGRISNFSLAMLILSGISTGLSWLCYYRALELGEASRVASVDKLSVALVVLMSVVFLGEPLTFRFTVGCGAILFGALLIVT